MKRIMTMMVAIAVALITVMAVLPSADAAESDVRDLYTYSPNFISTSTDAQHIKWDFGDGTPTLDSKDAESEDDAVYEAYKKLLAEHGGNVWSPVHTFAEKGTYTVTLTVWNPYVPEGIEDTGQGSSDSTTMTVRIMGHPTITLVSEGEIVDTITVPKEGRAGDYAPHVAPVPNDPVREGYVFGGWFTDDECTQAYDWSSTVPEHITLYAKWTSTGGGNNNEEKEKGLLDDRGFIVSVVIATLGIVALFVGIRTGNRMILVVGLVVAIIGGLSAYVESIGSDLITWIKDAFSFRGGDP